MDTFGLSAPQKSVGERAKKNVSSIFTFLNYIFCICVVSLLFSYNYYVSTMSHDLVNTSVGDTFFGIFMYTVIACSAISIWLTGFSPLCQSLSVVLFVMVFVISAVISSTPPEETELTIIFLCVVVMVIVSLILDFLLFWEKKYTPLIFTGIYTVISIMWSLQFLG